MFQLRFLEKFPPDNTFFGRIYRNWVGWRPGQRWIRPYRSKSAVGTRLSRKIARCESPSFRGYSTTNQPVSADNSSVFAHFWLW